MIPPLTILVIEIWLQFRPITRLHRRSVSSLPLPPTHYLILTSSLVIKSRHWYQISLWYLLQQWRSQDSRLSLFFPLLYLIMKPPAKHFYFKLAGVGALYALPNSGKLCSDQLRNWFRFWSRLRGDSLMGSGWSRGQRIHYWLLEELCQRDSCHLSRFSGNGNR